MPLSFNVSCTQKYHYEPVAIFFPTEDNRISVKFCLKAPDERNWYNSLNKKEIIYCPIEYNYMQFVNLISSTYSNFDAYKQSKIFNNCQN